MEKGGLIDTLLKKGELPSMDVNVTLDTESLVKLAVTLILVALVIIIINAITKKITTN